ncbi:hypothetical protein ES288_D08G143900v1 [Gossypium darwinii]|uniref:Uncharacterized protein n=1 Tax=Gossypium darwinii TaxID=34276 RepID=A0A5D2BKB1_GOSDA|nr:hypothetical protein ES288_D08G143900v1 [Gossypium darwinii]
MYMPNRATTSAPKAQAPTPKRKYNKLKSLPEFLNNWIVTESLCKNRKIDKKYHHKERNITLRSLLEVKRYETDYIFPVRGKKKNESNGQSESPASFLKTNSENMHMSNLTASASTAPKASKHGRKRKMKTVVSSEVEASIGVEQNGKATPIDVPINDEAASIDVPIIDEASLIDVPNNDEPTPIDVRIIDEAALIDVPITYVENFSDLG